MNTQSRLSWLEDPTRVEAEKESCKMELSSDRQLSRFYLQMRYARPSSDVMSGGKATFNYAFLDGFLSVVNQLGYNQSMEVTDACTAKICQQLRPRVTPVAAKPDIARLCTLLNRLVDGVLDTCDFCTESTSAWEDSYCCTNGYVLFEIDPQTQEIRCQRIDPLLTYYRRSEGRNPIHLYIDEPISKDVLIERYPEKESEIMKAAPWFPETVLGVDAPRSSQPDTVCLTRAYRRRIGDQDGKYVVAVGRNVLNGDGEGEPWEFDFFPVAVARNRWDHKGWAGIPMMRFLAPHAYAINRLARIAEDSFKGAVPYVSSHQDSGYNETSDVPFKIVKWRGSIPPTVNATNPVSDQVLARIDYHDAKSYAIAGINKAIAQGQAPKGVVAAVAMREVMALADARASEYQKHWESLYRQAGHIVVALAKKLKSVRIRSTDANAELMEEINPREIKLERNDYRIGYGVSSALSKGISGLLSDLQEFKDLGFIDTVDMAQAIGDKVPDLQATMDNATAGKRLAAKMVQDALEKGEIPTPPSVNMQGPEGMDTVIMLGRQAWCRAMLTPDRYSPENREVLRRLIKVAAARKNQPQQVQTPQPNLVTPGAAVPNGALLTAGTPGAPPAPPPAPGPAPGAPPPAPQAGP